jgi:Cys-tRNA(Pro)/Cys-tRNA(Cys) deacylase
MSMALASVHEHVRAALERCTGPYRVHEHRRLAAEIAGPPDVARALSIEPARIAKTLLLVEQGGERRYALLCCAWDARADVKALASRLGYGRLQFASAEALAEVLGYPRGGVSPLGAPPQVPVAIDAALNGFPSVVIGAGAQGVEIELAMSDLEALTGAVVGAFATAPA